MKTRTGFFVVLALCPILMGCSSKKAISTGKVVKDTKSVVVQPVPAVVESPVTVQEKIKPDIVLSNQQATVVKISPYLRTMADLKKYSIVVGAFSTLENTAKIIQAIEQLGYKPMVVPNETGLFRVIASSYNDRDSADIDALGFELDGLKNWILVK